MDLNVRILLTTIATAVSLWLLIDATESESEPDTQTRLKLWCSGFALGFSIIWLVTGGAFMDLFWFKLFGGVIGGFQWAYWVVGTIRIATDHKKNDDSDNR